MFGLEQIAWKEFLSLMVLVLLFWYLTLLITAWQKEKGSQKKRLYEQDKRDDFTGKGLALLTVSEKDFPSQLIQSISGERISSPTSFYEETGIDEGYELDYFLGGHEATLFSILSQVQCE